MNAILDTNILVRFFTAQAGDVQGDAARRLIVTAKQLVIPTPVFCEWVWVMRSMYRRSTPELLGAIEQFIGERRNVVVNEDEVEAGLAFMRAGGDFADGVVAYSGRLLAGRGGVFVSFDRKALQILQAQGVETFIPT